MKKGRNIFIEEEQSSFSKENEIDLEYMIDDFMKENINNYTNKNAKKIKTDIINYSYKDNEIEKKLFQNDKIEFYNIGKKNNSFFSKNYKKKHTKKIFNSNKNSSKNLELSLNKDNKIDNQLKMRKAKSFIISNNTNNNNLINHSLISRNDEKKNNNKSKTITKSYIYNKNKISEKINILFYKDLITFKNIIIKEINNIVFRNSKNNKISFYEFENIFKELKLLIEKEKKVNHKKKHKYGIKFNENYFTQFNTSCNNTIANNITPNSKIVKIKNIEELLMQKEIDFYAQLWRIISDSKENIESNKFIELIKKLLSSNNFNFYRNNNKEKRYLSLEKALKNKKFIYPSTKKEISYDKIWSIEALINNFIILFAKHGINDILNDYSSLQFIIDNKRNNEKKRKINSSKLSNKKNEDFLYKRYKNKFEQIAKNDKDCIKELSFQPKINNNYIVKKELFNQSKSKFVKTKEKSSKININNININKINIKNISIFEKLYKQDKINRRKRQKIIEDNLIIEKNKTLEECTFKPKINKNNSYKKIFNDNNKPKGYDEYKNKIREAIAKAEKRKIEKNK